jgi:hypothetical protein
MCTTGHDWGGTVATVITAIAGGLLALVGGFGLVTSQNHAVDHSPVHSHLVDYGSNQ